uniref:Uncharacterized protein n=1 Tax=Chrysotila carterae TaxID=13221 RepID=A0A7S4C314_CHRCT
MRPRDAVVLSVLCPTLIVQYILLWVAATSAYVHFTACHHNQLGGVKGSWRAWDAGLCFTEEQLWCRANPDKHPDCKTADCRAEEVRLSLGGDPVLTTVFTGCSQADTDRIVFLRRTYGLNLTTDTPNDDFVDDAVCVPPGDKRSRNVQLCMTDAEASARGLFYISRPKISIRWPLFNCTNWRSCKEITVDPPPGT